MIISSKQGYCNDHFKLVKKVADSLLVEVIVVDRGSFCCYQSQKQSLQIGTASVIKIKISVITNRDNYYKLVYSISFQTD